jgi:hypothetical protein
MASERKTETMMVPCWCSSGKSYYPDGCDKCIPHGCKWEVPVEIVPCYMCKSSATGCVVCKKIGNGAGKIKKEKSESFVSVQIDGVYKVIEPPKDGNTFKIHDTVKCHNCTGREVSMCIPRLGCTLCEHYGDGQGNLSVEYSKKTNTIMIHGEPTVFPACSWTCLFCKDSKKRSHRVFDGAISDSIGKGWSDHGQHLMPTFDVPCYNCCEAEYDEQLKKLTTEYYAIAADVRIENARLAEEKRYAVKN